MQSSIFYAHISVQMLNSTMRSLDRKLLLLKSEKQLKIPNSSDKGLKPQAQVNSDIHNLHTLFVQRLQAQENLLVSVRHQKYVSRNSRPVLSLNS